MWWHLLGRGKERGHTLEFQSLQQRLEKIQLLDITGRSFLSIPAETEREPRCDFGHQLGHICDGKGEVLILSISSCEKYKPWHCVMRRDWAPSSVSVTAAPATGALFLLSPALKITDLPMCSVTSSPLTGTWLKLESDRGVLALGLEENAVKIKEWEPCCPIWIPGSEKH